MLRLRQRGQREAKRIWRDVSPDNLDGTFKVGLLEMTVSTLQKEAARLSSGYLAAFIASELGEPERPPPLTVWDKSFGGGDLLQGLRSAVIATKQKIADGQDPVDATRASRANLVATVGLFIDTAARESLREGMEADDRIVGYQRAVKGTCEACMGAADGSTLPAGTPLDIHPNCDCVSEPVIQSKQPAETQRSPGFLVSGSAEQQTLSDWTSYGDIWNKVLRGESPRVAEAANAIPNAKRLEGIVAEKGEKAPTLYRLVETERLASYDLSPGKVFADRAFASTSADRAWIEDATKYFLKSDEQTIFEIHGARAVNINKVLGAASNFPQQEEWLLQRGTRFVVESVKREGKRTTVVLRYAND